MKLAPLIQSHLGGMIQELTGLGYTVQSQNIDGLGYVIELKGTPALKIVCDKGEFSVEGTHAELEPHGLGRVYMYLEREAFHRAVVRYVLARREK